MTAPLYLPFLNINPGDKDSFLLYRRDINNLLSDSASHRQLQHAETNKRFYNSSWSDEKKATKAVRYRLARTKNGQ